MLSILRDCSCDPTVHNILLQILMSSAIPVWDFDPRRPQHTSLKRRTFLLFRNKGPWFATTVSYIKDSLLSSKTEKSRSYHTLNFKVTYRNISKISTETVYKNKNKMMQETEMEVAQRWNRKQRSSRTWKQKSQILKDFKKISPHLDCCPENAATA